MPEWETVSSPQGAFIGWGDQAGQFVEGKVLSYGASDGRDPNKNACPEVTVELTQPAASFRKGQRTDHQPGTVVKVTAAQVALKRDLITANPQPGDLIRIELTRLVPTDKSPAKVFEVKIARGAGGPVAQPQPAPQPVQQPTQPAFGQQSAFGDAKPPF